MTPEKYTPPDWSQLHGKVKNIFASMKENLKETSENELGPAIYSAPAPVLKRVKDVVADYDQSMADQQKAQLLDYLMNGNA